VVAAAPGTQVLPQQPRGAAAVPPPPPYDEPRRTGWLWAGIVLAILVLGLGGYLLYQALNNDRGPGAPTTLVMPNLVDKPLDVATQELKDLGFVGTITQTPETNDAVPENVVFKQDPAVDAEVATDGQITLTYNPPKAPFTLGNFVGAQIADVTAALDQAKVPYEIKGIPERWHLFAADI
jgi:hypothetical protein